MTGDDLLWWLEELWYDITNPGQANIFFLAFRVAVVYVFAWFFWNILNSIYRSVKMSFFWRVRRFMTAPQRWLRKKKQQRELRREQEEYTRRQAEILEQRRREEEAQRAHEKELVDKIMNAPPITRRKR